ncbi:MAG: RNA polymerase sigma 70 [Gammaproteobacteria bacterium BRH_c0]|nr:MAG: RNA polymerase sigma 70 [Gammaproteobacteria bacterium BRH_c0]
MKEQLTTLIPAIRRFAYSLTGSPHDADDLLQNTLLRVLDRDVPEDVALIKWCFRVCRNLWIDEYRSRKIRQVAANDPELIDSQVTDGAQAIYDNISLHEVNRAMDRLPDQQRAIIALVALEGMSYKDVAATLQIPLGTVMSRLARARVSLSEQLKTVVPGTARGKSA